LWLPSPAGLRLEISCESDKKKMNFIFNYTKKISLTEKMKCTCRCETKNSALKEFNEPATTDFESPREHSLLIGGASRVDRIHLCGQFLASASAA
jgi:hypothetical protein